MPVTEMLRRMPSSEITEWIAFYDLRANPPPPKAAKVREVLDVLVQDTAKFQRRKSR